MSEAEAAGLMRSFADRTGLSSDAEPRRYLWTDAFAVINFLELHRRTKDVHYRELAVALIEQVHSVLGRHRPDDARCGWLTGLGEEEGAVHPTQGGLRIGKPLPERRSEEQVDERLEWDRDGQYFHYLTKWMDALCRASSLLGRDEYRLHAAELAKSVFPRFLQRAPSGEPLGLAWKMSIDLSRPLVSGLSPHDALDGFVTFAWVQAAGEGHGGPDLGDEIEILRTLAAGEHWGTADPLGIGGLLLDAFRLALLPHRSPADAETAGRVLTGAAAGLRIFAEQDMIGQSALGRLAFRELGLAIGLQALPSIATATRLFPELAQAAGRHLAALEELADTGSRIIQSWSKSENRQNLTWQDHRDINEVMLATALLEAQVGTAIVRAAGA